MGIYGRGWHDPGFRRGVLPVGSHHVCGKRGGVWMGFVGACGGGPGGVFVGIRMYTSYLLSSRFHQSCTELPGNKSSVD